MNDLPRTSRGSLHPVTKQDPITDPVAGAEVRDARPVMGSLARQARLMAAFAPNVPPLQCPVLRPRHRGGGLRPGLASGVVLKAGMGLP
jgi:hypothetical protein